MVKWSFYDLFNALNELTAKSNRFKIWIGQTNFELRNRVGFEVGVDNCVNDFLSRFDRHVLVISGEGLDEKGR